MTSFTLDEYDERSSPVSVLLDTPCESRSVAVWGSDECMKKQW